MGRVGRGSDSGALPGPRATAEAYHLRIPAGTGGEWPTAVALGLGSGRLAVRGRRGSDGRGTFPCTVPPATPHPHSPSDMYGAILGDIAGSVHEHAATKSIDFPLRTLGSRFTDDTVLTVATADALLRDGDYAAAYRRWGRRYPHAGYGGAFRQWLAADDAGPYGSWGNGSAMRVAPVGWWLDDLDAALEEARRSAAVTHDHPEGIRGAQAVAGAVFLARTGVSKEDIRRFLTERIGYDLSRTIDEIRPGYRFDVSCQGSVPEALTAFLESRSVEDAVRLAISLGGDADTQACIAGSVAEAYFGMPRRDEEWVTDMLPEDLHSVAVIRSSVLIEREAGELVYANDPSWDSYTQTVLVIEGDGAPFEVDLRKRIADPVLERLRGLFPSRVFGVVTACNPRGRTIDDEENERRVATFEERLRATGSEFVVATGMSPDGAHSERGFAIARSSAVCRALAVEAGQSAFFWFDGDWFSIRGAQVGPVRIPLPR